MKKVKNEQQLSAFCRLVGKLRHEAQLTQREMADRLEIGVGSIRKLESGEIPPRLTLKVIARLQTEFGVALCDQFACKDDKEQ